MPAIRNEAQVQLALHAMQNDPQMSLRSTATLFSVPLKTLQRRRKGIRPRTETIANSRKLDPLEEEVIIQRVLDLYK